jgi:hypothetical protein
VVNGGRITDLLTNEDEVSIYFGVGALFQFQANEVAFKKNTEYKLPSGALTFPCFSGEFLWVRLVEIDEYEDDKFFAMLNCSTLQIGSNVYSIPLTENVGVFSTSAAVVEMLGGFTFGFADNTGGASEPSLYNLTFEVTETCNLDVFN